MAKRCGVLRVSNEMLAAILKLPPEHSITYVLPTTPEDMVYGNTRFIIMGPLMPEVPEGAPLPEVDATVNVQGVVTAFK